MPVRQTGPSKKARISGRKLEAYFARIAALENAADSAIYRFCLSQDFATFEDAAAALSDAAAAVVESYGNAIGTAGGAWIQQTLELAGDTTGAQLVQAAALEALAHRPAEVLPPELAGALSEAAPTLLSADRAAKDMAAKKAARATVTHTRKRAALILTETVTRADATAEQLGRDPLGLLVAWVPGSPHPCGFCTLLASNGWRTAQRKALQAYSSHIHEGCRCQQVFRPANIAIGGYSPKKWAGVVDSVRAEATRGNGKIDWAEAARAIDRKNYAIPEVGDEIRRRHREDYARRNEAGENTD
jgi:hypothetical protein